MNRKGRKGFAAGIGVRCVLGGIDVLERDLLRSRLRVRVMREPC